MSSNCSRSPRRRTSPDRFGRYRRDSASTAETEWWLPCEMTTLVMGPGSARSPGFAAKADAAAAAPTTRSGAASARGADAAAVGRSTRRSADNAANTGSIFFWLFFCLLLHTLREDSGNFNTGDRTRNASTRRMCFPPFGRTHGTQRAHTHTENRTARQEGDGMISVDVS